MFTLKPAGAVAGSLVVGSPSSSTNSQELNLVGAGTCHEGTELETRHSSSTDVRGHRRHAATAGGTAY